MIGVVILIVSTIVMLGMLVFLIVKQMRWPWPEGNREDATVSGHTAHTFVEKDIILAGVDQKRFAKECALAAYATARAWDQNPEEGDPVARIRLKRIVVKVVKSLGIPGAAATQGTLDRKFGRESMPTVTMEAAFVAELLKTGEPVIHELLHDLLGRSHREVFARDMLHEEPNVWHAKSGDASIQGQARDVFSTIKVG